MKMQEYEASKKGAGKKASAKAAGKTILKPVMRHNFEAEAAVIKKNGKKK
jgi:hypothetical protein